MTSREPPSPPRHTFHSPAPPRYHGTLAPPCFITKGGVFITSNAAKTPLLPLTTQTNPYMSPPKHFQNANHLPPCTLPLHPHTLNGVAPPHPSNFTSPNQHHPRILKPPTTPPNLTTTSFHQLIYSHVPKCHAPSRTSLQMSPKQKPLPALSTYVMPSFPHLHNLSPFPSPITPSNLILFTPFPNQSTLTTLTKYSTSLHQRISFSTILLCLCKPNLASMLLLHVTTTTLAPYLHNAKRLTIKQPRLSLPPCSPSPRLHHDPHTHRSCCFSFHSRQSHHECHLLANHHPAPSTSSHHVIMHHPCTFKPQAATMSATNATNTCHQSPCPCHLVSSPLPPFNNFHCHHCFRHQPLPSTPQPPPPPP